MERDIGVNRGKHADTQPGVEREKPWTPWVKFIGDSLQQLGKDLAHSADLENPSSLHTTTRERPNPEAIGLALQIKGDIDKVLPVIVSWLGNPSGIDLCCQVWASGTHRLPKLPLFFNTEKLSFELAPEAEIQIGTKVYSAILDPGKKHLPDSREKARLQAMIKLEDLDPEDYKRLLSYYKSLNDGADAITRHPKLDAVTRHEMLGRLENIRRQGYYGTIRASTLDIIVRRAWFQEAIGVLYNDEVGLRIAIGLDQSISASQLSGVLPGANFERPIAVPGYLEDKGLDRNLDLLTSLNFQTATVADIPKNLTGQLQSVALDCLMQQIFQAILPPPTMRRPKGKR
jgi:hypothetical protein